MRLTYSDLDNDGVLEELERIIECYDGNCLSYFTSSIIKENNYYPFGLSHEGYNQNEGQRVDYKYRYNGKEYQDELGLNMYDYGARNYNPSIGRWMNIDPLSEQMSSYSPYNYCFNNPIRFTDPDGMSPDGDFFGKDGSYLGNDGVNDGKVYVLKDGYVPNYENKNVNFGGQLSESHSTDLKNKSNEVSMDSNLGFMIRAVYAEMRSGSDEAKSIVAESIKNRSVSGTYESADGTYKGIVNSFYDVSDPKDKAHDSFKNPTNHIYDNKDERSSWISSVSASIKADSGQSNVGQGVIFYNSQNGNIYDNNPQMQKIHLQNHIPAISPNLNGNNVYIPKTISGIKGLWKLK